MRIVIVGAGALGGFFGAQLSEAGEEVVLVGTNPARIKLINEEGLYLAEGSSQERCVRVRLVDNVKGLAPADLVFVAVKSYQTREAVEGILDVIGPETQILTVQNGLGHTEILAELLGEERVACGITYHSIQHVGPNRLRYRAGIKPVQIASMTGAVNARLSHVTEVFTAAGLKTEIVENIQDTIWQKLLHNAVINPVSAVTGRTCREMLEDDDLQAFMRAACGEIVGVMRARGTPIFDEEDPYRPLLGSQKALDKNRPSMWQDLSRGCYTEVEAINGAVVREAESYGLEAPLNWGLVRFIHSRERWKIRVREKGHKTLQKVLMERKPMHSIKMTSCGMKDGRIPLETAPKLKELLRSYYKDLEAASEDPSRRVAWVSGLAPVEIVRAFGLAAYFPENHAALIGSSRQAGKYIPRAMNLGFSQFISSAMACDIGAMAAGDSPLVNAYGISGPPNPDVIVYSTNNGHDLLHWFEYYGRHFKAPVLGLHPAPGLNDVDAMTTNVAAQRLLHFVDRLETMTVSKLDLNRLSEVVALSSKAVQLWGEILDLACNVPAPITYFDMLIHMAPVILMRGTPEAVEYYEILKAELEERVAANQAAIPGERFRLYWDGPPIWGALKPLAKLFMDRQVAVVASTFCSISAMGGFDPNNPIESMAMCYQGIFPNRSEQYKSLWLADKVKSFGVDGVFFHEGRTCPEHSNVRYGLAHRLQQETGIPIMTFEADSHDLRLFAMEQVRHQLDNFVEKMSEAQALPISGI